jgi:hypothetical protein
MVKFANISFRFRIENNTMTAPSQLRRLMPRSAILLTMVALTAVCVCVGKNQVEPLVIVLNGKYGFIDHAGKIIIQPQYIWAEDFWHRLGTVYVCGQYVSIDSSGNLLPLRVAIPGHLEPRQEGKKVGFVNADGRFEISPTFDDALPFSDGFAAVQIGDLWGFVDATGRQVIHPQFDAAYYFNQGVATAELKSTPVLIDTSGKVLASGYRFVRSVSNGLVPASRDGKAGYLDLRGQVAIPFLYEDADSFSGELAAVKKEGKWGYLGQDGQTVIPFEFDEAGPFSNGLAPVKVGARSGFINKTGRFSFELPFRQAPGFLAGDEESGLFIAETDVSRFWTVDDKFGYVNTSGRVIWGPITGSPDHPPLTGWSEEDKTGSCEGVPTTLKAKIASFSPR